MIALEARRRNLSGRRSAFTLLEVLVVVAILVVLASVASIAVFRYLEESREDKATLDMQALEKSYKTLVVKSGGEVNSQNFNLGMLVPYLETGEAALIDPWGKPYMFRFGQSTAGDERIQFYTLNKDGTRELVWPKQ
jgi:general secretion pathway protein G